MPLHSLKLPQPDTRLVRHGKTIYKFKLQYTNTHPKESTTSMPCAQTVMDQEIEAVIRVLLHADKKTVPAKIETQHFHVDCSCKGWPAANDIIFEQKDTALDAHPYVFLLSVLPRMNCEDAADEENVTDVETENQSKIGSKSKKHSDENTVREKRKTPRKSEKRSQADAHAERFKQYDSDGESDGSENKERSNSQMRVTRLKSGILKQKVPSSKSPYATRLRSQAEEDGARTSKKASPQQNSSVNSHKRPKSPSNDSRSSASLRKRQKLDSVRTSRHTVTRGKSTDSEKMPSDVGVRSSSRRNAAKRVSSNWMDHKLIEKEDKAEERKLKQLAQASTPPPKNQTRRTSLYEAAFNIIVTPVKKLFS